MLIGIISEQINDSIGIAQLVNTLTESAPFSCFVSHENDRHVCLSCVTHLATSLYGAGMSELCLNFCL